MRRLLIVAITSMPLLACSLSPEEQAERRAAEAASAKRSVEQGVRAEAERQRAKLISDCHGGDVVFMLPREKGREMIRNCERMVDTGVLAEGSRMGLDANGNMIVIAPSEVEAYQMAQAVSAPAVQPTSAAPSAYVPVTAVNRAGEVFDAYVCREVGEAGYDPQPSCEHMDTATVWVEDMDDSGRARIRVNGEHTYALVQRVLLNCKGTATTMRTFWNNSTESYDFRACG